MSWALSSSGALRSGRPDEGERVRGGIATSAAAWRGNAKPIAAVAPTPIKPVMNILLSIAVSLFAVVTFKFCSGKIVPLRQLPDYIRSPQAM
jgi:hypothetical protein